MVIVTPQNDRIWTGDPHPDKHLECRSWYEAVNVMFLAKIADQQAHSTSQLDQLFLV